MPILSRVHGVIEEKRADALILFAGGLGFEILVPMSTLSQLPEPGQEATLRTYLHLREGAIGLYGFLTAEEQRMFELLLTVSGVGPKSALSCLSLHSVSQLATAVAAGDIATLQRVPGIGRRTAERIALELKNRVGELSPAGITGRATANQNEVIEVLMFYGYSASEAAAAVATIPKDRPLTIEEQTMWALRYFAPRSDRKAGSE
jgi:Holliday junction DNA helicase RuvA